MKMKKEKRFFSWILTFAIVCSLCAVVPMTAFAAEPGGGNAPQGGILYGDVNNDGVVTLSDVKYLLKYFTKTPGYTTIAVPESAEVDGQSGVSIGDALTILRHVAGWKKYSTLPLNTPLSGQDLTITPEESTIIGGIYGNVTIAESVGNGEVTLSGVTITGKLIVKGGGSNTVKVEDSVMSAVQVDKDTGGNGAQTPRIALSNTPVQSIEAVQPVIIEADQSSPVSNVDAKDDVIIQGAATKVESVTVPASAGSDGVKLTVDGAKVSEVSAEQPVTIEANNNASPIEKVEAKNNVTVTGDSAQINTVEVPDTATTAPVINVQSGTVAEVKADHPAEVTGSGTVTNVEANAAVTVNSDTVSTVTVNTEAAVNISGSSNIEVAVETTQQVNIAAPNASVAVSTTQTAEVSVTVNEQAVSHIHKWVEDTTQYVAPTCSTTGTRVYACHGTGTCDLNETKTETLAKLPHTEKVLPAVAATCTQDGLSAGKRCSVCNATLVAQTQTATALGHSWAAEWSHDDAEHWHVCTREGCGAVNDRASHTWDAGVKGADDITFTCTICDATKTAPADHVKWTGNGILSWEPNEMADGYRVCISDAAQNRIFYNNFGSTTTSYDMNGIASLFLSETAADYTVEVAWKNGSDVNYYSDYVTVHVGVSGDGTDFDLSVDDAAKGDFTVTFDNGTPTGTRLLLWKHGTGNNYAFYTNLTGNTGIYHNNSLGAIAVGDVFRGAVKLSEESTADVWTLNTTPAKVITIKSPAYCIETNEGKQYFNTFAEALAAQPQGKVTLNRNETVTAEMTIPVGV